MGAQSQRAAVGHGIDRIEDEIGERFPDFAFHAHDRRQVRRQFDLHLDDDAALQRHIAPAGAGQVETCWTSRFSCTGDSVSCGSRCR